MSPNKANTLRRQKASFRRRRAFYRRCFAILGNKSTIRTIALALVAPVIAQKKGEFDALLEKVRFRSEVLEVGSDIALQFSLPPQCSKCLHATFTEAQDKNPVAHRYL